MMERARRATPQLSTGTIREGDPSWREQAACLGLDPATFFPDSDDGIEYDAPKGVCHGCEVRYACLVFALESNESEGCWGGLSPKERRRIRRSRRDAARVLAQGVA